MSEPVPEHLYVGDLVSFPGPWSFLLPKSHVILVSDEELETLADPDAKIDMSPWESEVTLRRICERAKAHGHRTMILAFDHFFAQYRPGQDKPRRLTPDMNEYVQLIAKISRFIEGYGLGLELSLLSPLEIGPAFAAATGEQGMWLHYRKGVRDPVTGAYSVQFWQQTTWANNKGVVKPADAGVRVFAFREERIHGTPYRVVRPESIADISHTAQVETLDSLTTDQARRVRVYGSGGPEGFDRVLAVQQYRTPEMDYFSPRALPFLKSLIDRYVDAGVRLNALYSDEMHIQQDWAYFSHHDNGEFAVRYVTDNLARRYAELYGEQFRDLAKYMVYFCFGQEDTAHDVLAKEGAMHVFGPTPEDIRSTALFRSRYYRLLQDCVVDLFTEAKRHAESKIGHRLEARAHPTWAESPTIDYWNVGRRNMNAHKYEYTSDFLRSVTVHQAASACHDYFKWGEFLTGSGNDIAEGGFLDRNYWALSLACSTGIINEVPYSYAAAWGLPNEIANRRISLASTYGAAGSPLWGIVQDMQHRDVDVLMLYPIDLVAADERFGSWMTQYAYANYITQAKLLEMGVVASGGVELAGRRFTTLAAAFEPFPSERLLRMMRELAESGGRVIWSGPPPVLTAEGTDALAAWSGLFGVDYSPDHGEGVSAPGKMVVFENSLAGVAPQVILTDFLVDHIYPVVPREPAEVVARVKKQVVGTHRRLPGGGTATFLGYRPRDDQSGSLGYETRNWFEVLSALGAYPPTGAFDGTNDNTEHLSRTTGYLCCRFPNGATAIAPHLRDIEENWEEGFIRNEEADREYIERNPLPPADLKLRDFRVNGHTVTYDGVGAMAFRLNDRGDLIAFAGSGCKQITIDGMTTAFAESDIPQLAWAPVPENRRSSANTVVQLMAHGTGKLRIPAVGLPEAVELAVEGATPGSRGETVPCEREQDALVFEVTQGVSGRWLYVVGRD